MYEFHGLTGYNRWVRTPSGRSARQVTVAGGLLLIVHVATGKFSMQYSNGVSSEADSIIAKLDQGKYKNKKFNQLVSMDSDLELLEMKCSKSVAQSHMTAIRKSLQPNHTYLLLD